MFRNANMRLFAIASKDEIGGCHQVLVVMVTVKAGLIGLNLSILLSQFSELVPHSWHCIFLPIYMTAKFIKIFHFVGILLKHHCVQT